MQPHSSQQLIINSFIHTQGGGVWGGASPVTDLINLVFGISAALFGRLPAMPVSVLAEGAVPDAQVTSHLTRIPMAEISLDMDCSRKSVQVCPVRRAVSSAMWY